ncbi:glycosylphosphatidylinositol anchor attachment 1 protein [Diabrotica undecimpunctata]|uniref:glycosylphosphatidylinositol anchor attachment 1 protein n=1 Tax=Diabrotica undecimpunctata TaxID=50387 RepID=UPI003B63B7C8
MGLLTDPTTGQGKYVKWLLKYYSKLCFLLYISGVIWFCTLAYPTMNASTYFSENALLPGLVKSQFREDREALRYNEELQDEMKKYEDSIPYPWIVAKFKQIGLDAYIHNFTLTSPFNRNEKFSGKNIYGILRAPRGASTEALVLSTPYRPSTSVHPPTGPSIAIMLAFAKYANREKYWAKDIIFLITEHEQLGTQAWLEAYYGVSCGSEEILDHGDLRGRGGAIQAAINLELHSEKIGQMDIKIEGLNGQLPNLDLFNLASKMCAKEGVYQTFKNKGPRYSRDPVKEWWNYFKNLLSMMATQASGIPNGNHGLFHRFGIQALTLEGFERSRIKSNNKIMMVGIGRVIEGIFRSLNNLLERFHQSFFFYLLPSSERYISISLYIPSVCLMAGTMFIKACARWFNLQKSPEEEKKANPKSVVRVDKIIIIFLMTHFFGILISNLPQYVSLLTDYDKNTTIFYSLLASSGLLLFLPLFIGLRKCRESMELLNVLAMLELGTALICISMNNFSLGLFCATILIPIALLINPSDCRLCSWVQKLLWLLVHPITVLTAVVAVNSYLMFPEEGAKELLNRAWDATQKSILYGIVDSMIYGNWLYTVVTNIFLPNWLCFWIVSFSKQSSDTNKEKKD